MVQKAKLTNLKSDKRYTRDTNDTIMVWVSNKLKYAIVL